jgi:hypothetical protein
LVLSGVPDKLRSVIWRELLKVKIIEIEQIKKFQNSRFKAYHQYDKSMTVFENFKAISDKIDCLAFKQIDEDVRKFKFSNAYMENCAKKTDTIFYRRE